MLYRNEDTSVIIARNGNVITVIKGGSGWVNGHMFNYGHPLPSGWIPVTFKEYLKLLGND